MAKKQWWQEGVLFGKDYLRLYLPQLTEERTLKEVDFIEEVLQLRNGAAILDLCCGHGRHAIELAQRGYQVTALDLNQLFLDLAQKDAQARKVKIEFIKSDMRQIPFENKFDGVINMFTAFGYLENDQKDFKVIQQVSKALNKGGKFLIDLVNREWLIRNYQEKDWTKYKDGLISLEERKFDPQSGRNNVSLILIEPTGKRRETHHSLRLYTLLEMKRILENAGLGAQKIYGDYDKSEYTIGSKRMILLSIKTSK